MSSFAFFNEADYTCRQYGSHDYNSIPLNQTPCVALLTMSPSEACRSSKLGVHVQDLVTATYTVRGARHTVLSTLYTWYRNVMGM